MDEEPYSDFYMPSDPIQDGPSIEGESDNDKEPVSIKQIIQETIHQNPSGMFLDICMIYLRISDYNRQHS
jgi:hypothetical protein